MSESLSAAERDSVTVWLCGSDTGLSSKALAREALGANDGPKPSVNYPSDGADLGRCVRLIAIAPSARAAVDALAKRSPYWAALAPQWDRLVETYHKEISGDRSADTYAAMKKLLDPVTVKDSSVIRFGNGVTMRFGQ